MERKRGAGVEEFDVVVIGAGLAGLQCARLLGKAGLQVLLVDRKPSLEHSIHTTGIFVRRTLEDFALPEDCLGPPISNVTLYSPRRRALPLTSPHAEFRVGKMGKLYQRYLGHCLRAGVSWSPATSFCGIHETKGGLAIQLESPSLKRWVRARFLVGADGANSRVSSCLGLDANNEWLVGVEDVFNAGPLPGSPRLHCFLDPRLAPGYLAWVANDGEEVHVGVGGYAARFNPVHALEKFESSLGSIISLHGATRLGRRGGRIPVGGVLRNICNAKGLLIGDAAGAVSPLTAGGLDPCLRLSTLAARVITTFLQTGDERALEAYSGNSFRTRFASRLWMRRAISTVRNPFLLEVGCAALQLPLLNYFAWHVFFGRGSFPDIEEFIPARVEQLL